MRRFLEWVLGAGIGFRFFLTAWRTIQGYDTMHTMWKVQVRFIQRVFGSAVHHPFLFTSSHYRTPGSSSLQHNR